MTQDNKKPGRTDHGDFRESTIPERKDDRRRTYDDSPSPGRKIHDVVDTAPPPEPPKKNDT
jgi:hypothetical protein